MSKPAVTDDQLDILKHALAWPACYRNYYATEPDDTRLNALVDLGLMSKSGKVILGGLQYFHVTATGVRAVAAIEARGPLILDEQTAAKLFSIVCYLQAHRDRGQKGDINWAHKLLNDPCVKAWVAALKEQGFKP